MANALGSALPFAVTYAGKDPAVIVGPLMTTSVDSLGLMMYLLIATLYLSMLSGDDDLQVCKMGLTGCGPSELCTFSLPSLSCVPK